MRPSIIPIFNPARLAKRFYARSNENALVAPRCCARQPPAIAADPARTATARKALRNTKCAQAESCPHSERIPPRLNLGGC